MAINNDTNIIVALEHLNKHLNEYELDQSIPPHKIVGWKSSNKDTQPTDDEINAAWIDWKSKEEYKSLREEEYPDWTKQLEYIYDNAELPYYWRKHARLQQFMMKLNDAQNGINDIQRAERGMMSSFNGPMFLTREDILELQKLVENDNLPFCPDSFFWGHQFQEETNKEYKEQDLDFCKDALVWLDKGYQVVYICSW